MKESQFTPKFFSLLKKGISKEQLRKDIIAGVIVGIVALPLAIAFAIASGVSPDKGLITAIVAGLIISVLGGSRVQIGGPTGAFIVIVYAVVQEFGVDGLIVATFMAGIILIGMGLARLGNLLKFIPYPLIVGFTSGIAVIIFSSQIKDFFGLSIETVPADFVEKWKVYAANFDSINWAAVGIAVGTILLALNFQRISKKIPGSIVAILISTLAVYFFNIPVSTIETSFGDIPSKLSMPTFPDIDFATVQKLIQPAFAIALLGGIESLLSAVVSDGMIGGRHRSNAELVGQGIANCASSMFGGIPATGAIARTATNVNNGGRTPVAGIVHAVVLLVIMLALAPFAKLIPMACLAGILIVVAYHMSEWRQFKALLKGNKADVMILLVTFFLTVFFDLVIAIQMGIILSSFILMKRMSDATTVKEANNMFNNQENEPEEIFDDELPMLPKGATMYEIRGPLFFGATQTFQDTMARLPDKPKVLILRMRHVPFIDATGIYRLMEIIKKFAKQNTHIILSGVNPKVLHDLEVANIYTLLNEDNITSNIEMASQRAQEIIDS
ncbi:SulP family inorganic anion transporter [Aequorivita viscosa]|uniref:Sulfate permease, SulP family n=1 Tax=Aequorivita viscosa TaxID=797419 RepID=A0A1M6F795_9FLAO|nr:SulP family inorganic anion transporter [Aequorivita viscosa]SDW65702.1 sulfate permease, SulP family [Aequorivita viscosa]SHI93588.1 sulfate permease, SulP family [Aequorivita viscosa]